MAKSRGHRNFLREIAKFASGLVLADLLGVVWFISQDLIPMTFWGIEFTLPVAYLVIIFDAFLFLTLIHYAWHPRIMQPDISQRSLYVLIGLLTGVVAIIHLTRLAFGWEFTIGNYSVPEWLSWAGAMITAYISYASFHFIKK